MFHALGAGAAPVIHVDAAAAAGGIGSDDRPFQRLGDALARAPDGAEIELAPGLYEGAIELARPVTLRGPREGDAVIAAPGADVTVEVRADVQLADVAVQGGRTGVRVDAGRARLSRVAFKGQPEIALDCGGQPCELRDCAFTSSFATAVGIRARGVVFGRGVEMDGPFRRGFDLDGADAALEELTVAGAATGIQVEGGTLTLTRSAISDGRGMGLFASHATARVRDSTFARLGYGLLARDGAEVEVQRSITARCRTAGLAEVGAQLSVRDHVHVGPAMDAAIAFDGGKGRVDGALVYRPGPNGIRVTRAEVGLAHVVVSEAAQDEGGDFGDGVFLYDARAKAVDLEAVRCAGAAVEAQLGRAELHGLLAEGVGLAALSLEHQGWVDVAGLQVAGSRGVGVACIEGGRARLAWPAIEGVAQGSYLVDCSCQVVASPPGRGPPQCGPGPAGSLPKPQRLR